jgi:hypothetical protein
VEDVREEVAGEGVVEEGVGGVAGEGRFGYGWGGGSDEEREGVDEVVGAELGVKKAWVEGGGGVEDAPEKMVGGFEGAEGGESGLDDAGGGAQAGVG